MRPIPGTLVQPHEPGEVILPDEATVWFSQAFRGEPIYINFGIGHTVFRKQITPQHAIQLGLLSIEAGARELGHPKG